MENVSYLTKHEKSAIQVPIFPSQTNKRRSSLASANVHVVADVHIAEATQTQRCLLALLTPRRRRDLQPKRASDKEKNKTKKNTKSLVIEAPPSTREITSTMAEDEKGDQVVGMAPCT